MAFNAPLQKMNTIYQICEYLLGPTQSVAQLSEFKEFWISLTEDEKLDYRFSDLTPKRFFPLKE